MTAGIRNYSTLFSMAALLVGLALPAVAQDSADRGPTLNLGLAELYAAGELRLDLGKVLEAGRAGIEPDRATTAADFATAADADSGSGRQLPTAAWRYSERAELLQVRAAPKETRFGKWLKKHWYIPAIAAVAIGVVVLDDDGEDPNDPED